ncbi:terpene synthase family protein [Algoriphagus sp. AGSA1]|uniref:terpene synthase family protein n=1 Tax=Algoriphagus sp. AGSA1 TaxID=2907213 RepID=UPI001F167AAC|nr:terpene synthase family protein [Algoriphagus sp. AGSA1]MCE7056819.1 terpene synthase family protein [Algoriphagus sp. AGSA1]
MKPTDFHVAMHVDSPLLNELVLAWAITWLDVVRDDSDWEILQRSVAQKQNSFASYLFPQMERHRLISIANLFFCLFMVDDLLDILEEKNEDYFLKFLSAEELALDKTEMSTIGFPIDRCYIKVMENYADKGWKAGFESVWDNYIAGLRWERQNKRENRSPSLDEYRRMRPHSSGAYIAIHLLRGEYGRQADGSGELEEAIARYIYLANDLVSSVKEQAIGDNHNEVLLLAGDHGMKAGKKLVEGELLGLRQNIRDLGDAISKKSPEGARWVEGLFLLLGGCLFWSQESMRYRDGKLGVSTNKFPKGR